MSIPRIVLLVVAASYSGFASLGAQTSAQQSPQILTTGFGETTVTPDRATMLIGIQSRAVTANAAAADNARRQRAVLDTLRALGLSSDQLSTMNYNVSPEIQYPANGQGAPHVTGYSVTNTVRIELRRIDDVSRAIDASLAKGANEMSSLQFYSSKADSARRNALASAVSVARLDAEAMARAAGGSLGALLSLSTESAPPARTPMMAMSLAKSGAPTPIEAGEQTITATVTARWAFVPSR